jgi:hypothetical protein
MISALGGMLTVISVYLPWYGVSVTPAAINALQGTLSQIVPGWASSPYVSRFHDAAQGLAGRQIASVGLHQVFSHSGTLLAIAGGAATLLAMVSLGYQLSGPAQVGALRLIGLAATLVVGWRMFAHLPHVSDAFIQVSLQHGAYLGLLGSLAIVAGTVLPRSLGAPAGAEDGADVWTQLSGWTPGA